MATGEELALAAMKKEFKRLSRKADRAKAESEEYMGTGSEIIAIHEEFVAIVKSDERGMSVLKKLDALKKRREKTDKIRKKDLMKLLDKEYETAITRDKLGGEIQRLEFRLELRNRKAS